MMDFSFTIYVLYDAIDFKQGDYPLVAQFLGPSLHSPRVWHSIPSQGTYLSCRFDRSMFLSHIDASLPLSLPLSLPPPFSLSKINKHILEWGFILKRGEITQGEFNLIGYTVKRDMPLPGVRELKHQSDVTPGLCPTFSFEGWGAMWQGMQAASRRREWPHLKTNKEMETSAL